MTQLQDHRRLLDPRWSLTYQFTSAQSARQADNTHVLSAHLTTDAYPATAQARRALVDAYGPLLVEEWRSRRLPTGDLYHLVHRPGELLTAQRSHPADQAPGPTVETGGVLVVLVLANSPLQPRLVVSRVRFD